jgi:hypothetical protein
MLCGTTQKEAVQFERVHSTKKPVVFENLPYFGHGKPHKISLRFLTEFLLLSITHAAMRFILLAFVDVTLGFLMICLLPFAWILKDGIGPDSVSTTGLDAVWKCFMSFYVGPAILLFVFFDQILRIGVPTHNPKSKRGSIILWFVATALFSLFSLLFLLIFYRL